MNDVLALAAIAGVLAAILANISLWAPRKIWVKVTALLTTAALLPTGYAALVMLLGRPKPADLEWSGRNLSEAVVLSAQIREDEAIYLWLGLEGVAEPRSYALPWDEKLARQLHEARREARTEGSDLRMRRPFASSLDERERRFYAAPQPVPPPKGAAADAPSWFKGSRSGERAGAG